MAVYQATKKPAVSLPNGASSLPPEVLPLLEQFDKIYLWMDHDGAGQAGVDKFVQKLVRKAPSSGRPVPYNIQAYIDSSRLDVSPQEYSTPPGFARRVILRRVDVDNAIVGAQFACWYGICLFVARRMVVRSGVQRKMYGSSRPGIVSNDQCRRKFHKAVPCYLHLYTSTPVAPKQGVRRCLVVGPLAGDPNPPKDANEALLAGRNIQEFLDGERWEHCVARRNTRLWQFLVRISPMRAVWLFPCHACLGPRVRTETGSELTPPYSIFWSSSSCGSRPSLRMSLVR